MTSKRSRGIFACFCITARRSSILADALPLHTRRGNERFDGTTNAWISQSNGRVPSITTVRQDPGTRFLFLSMKNPESRTSTIPRSSIAKIPTSDESPNLFLNARKILVELSVCPDLIGVDAQDSRYKTQSTMWESDMGPATSPSFVTCPMIKTGTPFFLAKETILEVACLI